MTELKFDIQKFNSVINSEEDTLVSGSASDDVIDNEGSNVTIEGGAGSDTINNSGENVLFVYGGGNDIINGFNETSKLQVASGTLSTVVNTNGTDLILTVGANTITLKDAYALETVNIIDANDSPVDFQIKLNGTDGADNIENSSDNISIDGGNGNDNIVNAGSSVTISGGTGNDKISNSAEDVLFVYSGGNDTIEGFLESSTLKIATGTLSSVVNINGSDLILTVGANTITLKDSYYLENINVIDANDKAINFQIKLSGTDGADNLYNNRENVSIDGGAGKDTITNEAASVTISGGADNDSIVNDGASVLINGNDGNDTIVNRDGGGSSTVNGGAGSDKITNSAENVLFVYNGGNDTISGFGSDSTLQIAAGTFNSIINTNGTYLTISVGENKITLEEAYALENINIIDAAGKALAFKFNVVGTGGADELTSDQSNISIDGGAGNDTIENSGNSVTITGGAGNDSIINSGNKVLFVYNVGDGNDLIDGFDSTSTLQIGDGNATFSTLPSDEDIIVEVGDGKITLGGAASLDTLNIKGKEVLNLKWTLDGTTATYGTATTTLITIDNVKSLAGIAFDENKNIVTISAASLNQETVTITDGYTLKLGSDVKAPTDVKAHWEFANKTATYKDASTSAGYTLEDNQITYTEELDGAEVLSVKGVESVDGLSIKDDTVTVSAKSLGTSKVTISDEYYTLQLGSDVKAPSTTAAHFEGNVYKSAWNTAGYTLEGNEIIYTAATVSKDLFTLTGVKSTSGIEVIGKEVTVSKANLGTDKVTISGDYKLKLATDVDTVQEEVAEWQTLENGNLAYFEDGTGEFYSLSSDKKSVTYTAAKAAHVNQLEISGIKGKPTVEDNTVKFTTKNFDSIAAVVSNKGSFDFEFSGAFSGKTFTSGAGKDKITNSGTKITLIGGKGNDEITNTGKNVMFSYDAGDGNDTITGFNATSTLNIASGEYLTQKSGSDIVVKVDKGAITLKGAASLKTVNIEGTPEAQAVNTVITKNKDSFTGTEYDDTVKVSGQYVTINAGAGHDSVYSTGKDDSINVGGGDNIVELAKTSARQTVLSGAGNDTINNNSANNFISTGAGDDSIVNKGSNATINAGKGNDTIIGSSVAGGKNIFVYADGDGNDVITNYAATDIISITSGTATPKNSGKSDVVFTVGTGTITIKDGKDKIITYIDKDGEKTFPKTYTTNGKTIKLQADFNKDTFNVTDYGSYTTINASLVPHDISITGDKNANKIVGGKNNDILIGGRGNDTLTGGKGSDIFVWNKGDGNDVITDYDLEDKVSITSYAVSKITKSKDGEDIILTIGNKAGAITLKGASDKTITYVDKNGEHTYPVKINPRGTGATLSAEYDDETFDVAKFGSTIVTIDASAVQNDVAITANKKANRIIGGDGNDTIIGGTGNDTLTGGKGSDVFVYASGDGNDLITDYAAEDIVSITSGTAKLATKNKNVIITVGNRKITLTGGAGKVITYVDTNGEKTYSQTGLTTNADSTGVTLLSNYSAKAFDVNKNSNVSKVAKTIKTIDASKVPHSLTITGNDNLNKITGSSQDDSLVGNAGADTILGGDGKDTINGGKGNDSLKGGNGADTFIYNSGDGDDVIVDYTEGEDIISIVGGATVGNITTSKNKKDVILPVGTGKNAGKITLKNAASQIITYRDKNGLHTYPQIFTTDGEKITLTKKFNKDSFNVDDYEGEYKTIDASAVIKGIEIIGNAKANLIFGGTENDTIYGGKGNDTLQGNSGADVFVYSSGDGNDVIVDYASEDKIKIAKGTINSHTVKDKDVVFTIGSGKITVQSGAGKKITIINEKGKSSTKTYTAADTAWFLEDDNNFTTDNELSELVETKTYLPTAQIDTSTTLFNDNSFITYSNKK